MGNNVWQNCKEGTGKLFLFFILSQLCAELTHTTYAAFVSMRFSALNYNWGITHALRA